MFELTDGREALYQWDTGRTINVDGSCTQLHFSNVGYGVSVDVDVDTATNTAKIPDALLTVHGLLYVYGFIGNSGNGYTKVAQVFDVKPRPKPADYVYTEDELKTYEELEAKIQEIDGQIANLQSNFTEQITNTQNELSGQITDVQTNLSAQVENVHTELSGQISSAKSELENIRVAADGTTYETAGEAVRAQVSGLNDALTEKTDELKGDLDELTSSTYYFTRYQNFASNVWGKQFTCNYNNFASIDLPSGTYAVYLMIKAESQNNHFRIKYTYNDTTYYADFFSANVDDTIVVLNKTITVNSYSTIIFEIDGANFTFVAEKFYIVDSVAKNLIENGNNRLYVERITDNLLNEVVKNCVTNLAYSGSYPLDYTITNANGVKIGEITNIDSIIESKKLFVYPNFESYSGSSIMVNLIAHKSGGNTLFMMGSTVRVLKGLDRAYFDLSDRDLSEVVRFSIYIKDYASQFPANFRLSYLVCSAYDIDLYTIQQSGNQKIYISDKYVSKSTNKIYMIGDSIANQIAGMIKKYSDIYGGEFNNLCYGGETVQDSLFRANIVPYYCLPCVIPSSGSVTVRFASKLYLKETYNSDTGEASVTNGYVTSYGYTSNSDAVYNCSINGIKGTIKFTRNGTTNALFTRNESGEAITLNTAVPIVIERDLSNCPIICFMGTNLGWDSRFFVSNNEDTQATKSDADNLVRMYKLIKSKANTKCLFLGFYLGSNFTQTGDADRNKNWWEYFEHEMERTFGNEYFSVRRYLMSGGYKNAGLTLAETDISRIANGVFPIDTCTEDGTHLNVTCAKHIANKVLERIKELGIIIDYSAIN